MQVEYKKDLRHNYMVIKKEEETSIEQYCSRLLERQKIDGILPMELRYIDDDIYFYYDITTKQSMFALYEKTVLSFAAVMQLFQGIMAVFDKAYEYLLPEDSFVLAPEFIYLEVNGKKPTLCYLPGHSQDMKKQMNSLLEYLMNKVDYNDKDAVLLVYQLYATSREEGFSVNQIYEVLQKPSQPPIKEEQRVSRQPRIKYNLEETNNEAYPKISGKHTILEGHTKLSGHTDSSRPTETAGPIKPSEYLESPEHLESVVNSGTAVKNQNNRLGEVLVPPRMKERIDGEKEVSCYPIRNLILTGICILAGILSLILSICTGVIYNSFGNRIDYSKLLALVLILLCVEGYFIRKLLDKRSRITKLIKTCEYIDPWDDSTSKKDYNSLNIKTSIEEAPKTQDQFNFENKSVSKPILSRRMFDARSEHENSGKSMESMKAEEEEDNPTCILNAVTEQPTILILKALDDKSNQDIPITVLPFHIGKLKKNVEYCLDNDAVSRYHAKITKEGDLYYITDLNSTNGTFLNSEPLMTYQKKKIEIGDEIAFANMKYVLAE